MKSFLPKAALATAISATASAQQTLLFDLNGTATNERFGESVGFVRDLDPPGPNQNLQFVVSSSYLTVTPPSSSARVDVFDLLAAAPTTPTLTFTAPGFDETQFGTSLAFITQAATGPVGIVGSPGDTVGASPLGGRVFAAQANGFLGSISTGAPGDAIGTSTAILTDATGAAVAVLGGAPQPGTGAGYVADPQSAILLPAPVGATLFGTSMANVGDIDGDGIEDVLIGAPGGSAGGRAFLYSGASLPLGAFALPIASQQGTAGESFGTSVGPAGDVDQDGTPDYWICGPGFQFNTGRVRVFSGSTHTALYDIFGAAVGLAAGGSDIDGDFIPDLVVASAAGSLLATVHRGSDGMQINTIVRDLGDASPVTSLALGDATGDGRAEAIIGQAAFSPLGAPQAGRARVYELVVNAGTEFCFQSQPTGAGVFSSIRGNGTASLAANDLTVEVIDVLPGSVGLFFAGDGQQSIPAGGGIFGTLCVGGSIGRYNGQVGSANAAGQLDLTVNWLAMPTPSGVPISAMVGETWTFQCMHTDVLPGGTPIRNLTPALAVTVLP